MDSSKQLELFDLDSYGQNQLAVNDHETVQAEVIRLNTDFKQLELHLFPIKIDKYVNASIRIAA
jgi:hypothetical protein